MSASSNAYEDTTRAREQRRVRIGQDKLWWQKTAAERDAHDWLYAAAKKVLDRADETGERSWYEAARVIMDFADEEVQPHVR